jgi:hypothetical protein
MNNKLINLISFSQKLCVVLEKPQAVINEGFYEFAQERSCDGQQTIRRRSDSSLWHQEETPSVLGLVRIMPKV